MENTARERPGGDLEWVDRLVRAHRDRLQIREKDNTVAVFPDFAFMLGSVPVSLLGALLAGRRMGALARRFGGAERVAQLLTPVSDLRSVLEAPVLDSDGNAGARHMLYSKPKAELPVACEITLTHECPLNCRGCSYLSCCRRPRPARSAAELPAKTWSRVFQKLKSEIALLGVTITGGEPLLYRDLPKVLKYARSSDLAIHLVTSGHGLTPRIARKLAAFGVRLVTVKLLGLSDETLDRWTGIRGHREQALSAVSLLRQAAVPTRLCAALTRQSGADFPETVRLARKLGLKEVWVDLCTMSGAADRVPPEALDRWVGKLASICRLEGIRMVWSPRLPLCVADPVRSGVCVRHTDFYDGLMHVAPDGTVLPWPGSRKPLGSLPNDSVAEMWTGFPARRLLFLDRLPEPCRTCMYQGRCFGGAARLAGWRDESALQPVLPVGDLPRVGY
jgi:MoaA/NifB/PqqE/SkfB family radical SAM enzyme